MIKYTHNQPPSVEVPRNEHEEEEKIFCDVISLLAHKRILQMAKKKEKKRRKTQRNAIKFDRKDKSSAANCVEPPTFYAKAVLPAGAAEKALRLLEEQ